MIYPGKFGGVPSIGSRDIVGTRICHLNPSVTLKMRSTSPKPNQLLICPGKFGGIPLIGSRDIVGTRICHADTDTNANGNNMETNISLLTFGHGRVGGGHNSLTTKKQTTNFSSTKFKKKCFSLIFFHFYRSNFVCCRVNAL